MQKWLKSIFATGAVIFSWMIIGSAVLQFHHHDAADHLHLFVLSSEGEGHHSHDDGCPENDCEDCSLHLDKFITEKHVHCANPHCGVHFAPIILPAVSEAKPIHTPEIPVGCPQPPHCRSAALRAPPMWS